MTPRPEADHSGSPASAFSPSPRRWLLFVHQLPSTPSNLRVRTWRRLQQVGAIPIKQAVYVLPDSPGAREDFEWLKAEVTGAGGEASVFAADSVNTWSDDELVEQFRRSRQQAYAALAREAAQLLRRSGPRRRHARAPAWHRVLEGMRQRLAGVERIDFFGSAGRDRVVTLLEQLEERFARGGPSRAAKTEAGRADAAAYRRRLWVTRPRPGVDRMASAWLIRRFIDPEARFGFVPERAAAPRDAVPFDMFDVELSHRGDDCTFETLCETFGIRDAAAARLAGIVHDVDLKDGRFGAPEAGAVGLVIEGLQALYTDDDALLAQGLILFDALYRAVEQSGRRVGPRPVARQRKRGGPAKR